MRCLKGSYMTERRLSYRFMRILVCVFVLCLAMSCYDCKYCKDTGIVNVECDKCHSTGYIPCVCHNAGYRDCPFCVKGRVECARCNKGYINVDGVAKICTSCNGYYLKTCMSCSGYYRKVCPVCNGIKKVCPVCKAKKIQCPYCN